VEEGWEATDSEAGALTRGLGEMASERSTIHGRSFTHPAAPEIVRMEVEAVGLIRQAPSPRALIRQALTPPALNRQGLNRQGPIRLRRHHPDRPPAGAGELGVPVMLRVPSWVP
jgi:hypothetical protein